MEEMEINGKFYVQKDSIKNSMPAYSDNKPVVMLELMRQECIMVY